MDSSSKLNLATCRYCLQEDVVNNLKYPCRCSGTIKYVHHDCLSKWIKRRNIYKCEICKTKYIIELSYKYVLFQIISWLVILIFYLSLAYLIRTIFSLTNNTSYYIPIVLTSIIGTASESSNIIKKSILSCLRRHTESLFPMFLASLFGSIVLLVIGLMCSAIELYIFIDEICFYPTYNIVNYTHILRFKTDP